MALFYILGTPFWGGGEEAQSIHEFAGSQDLISKAN